MADLEDGLYTYLNTVTALTTLTSSRFYPDAAPLGVTKPYIVYSRAGTDPVHNLGTDSGYKKARVQFEIWAETALSAKAVARQLDIALNDRTATLGTTTIDRVIGPEIEISGYDSDVGAFLRSLEFDIWHVQA